MPEHASRNYETVRWVSEFIFVPLHWMMLSHWYSAATVIGSMVMVAYLASSYHQARAAGIIRKER